MHHYFDILFQLLLLFVESLRYTTLVLTKISFIFYSSPNFTFKLYINTSDTKYDVEISLLTGGGSSDDFYLILIGNNGQTDPHLVNGMNNGGQTYSFEIFDDDVGTLSGAYLVAFDDEVLIVTEINVNSNAYVADEFFGDYVGYEGSDLSGCEVLIADFGDETLSTQDQEPCTTMTLPQATTSPDSPYRLYSIELEIWTQGGSKDEIFAAIEGIDGNQTEFVSIGALKNGGETYKRTLNLTNVGMGGKLILLNYGDDSLLVHGCDIDGATHYELTYDTLEYDGADPRGCHTLTCDVASDKQSDTEKIPCLNYESDIPLNETFTFQVVIDVLTQGGSQDDIYLIVQGISGRMSDPYLVSMPDGGQSYSFDIDTVNVGDPKAVWLVKLGSDGDDALLVGECRIGDLEVDEIEGDLLEYTGDDGRGCGYVKCDFINNKMSKGEEDICNIIPVIEEVGSGSTNKYFVHVDTTNIPFSTPGGTEDEVWLRIINTDNEKSQYVSLGNDVMVDDGESYTFRPNVTNLGSDIAQIEFIQFGEDDLCIDFCQINGQIVDLGLFGVECNENDVDDNDGCAILTCDFELDQITSTVQSPCKHDVYGWRNQTHRVYTVIIDVCESLGATVDTWSANTFFIYLESEEYGLSEPFRVDGIGSDGYNYIYVNTTNIGTPDKLYLIHFNNDDLCIGDISVDGFIVDTFPYINSEYDCEYNDIGCNVITADFETNELDIETVQSQCQYIPDDYVRDEDDCLIDTVDSWVDQLFDFASTVGIITGIILIIVIICCVGGCCWCIWCAFIAGKLTAGNSGNQSYNGVEMPQQQNMDMHITSNSEVVTDGERKGTYY